MDAFDAIESSRDSLIRDLEREDQMAYSPDSASFESEAASIEHPILRSPQTTAYILTTVLLMVTALVALAFSAQIYFGAVQLQNTFDDMDLSLVESIDDKGGKTVKFSDACYTCEIGPRYTSSGKLQGTTKVMTFKGKMEQTETASSEIQFPNGVIIAELATILQQSTDSNQRNSYVAPRSLERKFITMAPGARLSTWNKFDSSPSSTFSLVPGTLQVDSSTGRTGACTNDARTYTGGPIYGAFDSTYAMGTCTCSIHSGAAIEYCLDLSTPLP